MIHGPDYCSSSFLCPSFCFSFPFSSFFFHVDRRVFNRVYSRFIHPDAEYRVNVISTLWSEIDVIHARVNSIPSSSSPQQRQEEEEAEDGDGVVEPPYEFTGEEFNRITAEVAQLMRTNSLTQFNQTELAKTLQSQLGLDFVPLQLERLLMLLRVVEQDRQRMMQNIRRRVLKRIGKLTARWAPVNPNGVGAAWQEYHETTMQLDSLREAFTDRTESLQQEWEDCMTAWKQLKTAFQNTVATIVPTPAAEKEFETQRLKTQTLFDMYEGHLESLEAFQEQETRTLEECGETLERLARELSVSYLFFFFPTFVFICFSFGHSSIHPFVHTFIRSFILIHSSFIHSFVSSFISFMHFFSVD